MSNPITAKGYRYAGAILLATGLFMVSIGFPWLVAFGAFVVGSAFLAAPTIIDGVPWLIAKIWNSGGPVWEGEVLHTDSGGSKVRYGFDTDGCAWFVVEDICRAIGTRPADLRAGGAAGAGLVRHMELLCFTEEGVRDYLAPLAAGNHEARRLLVLVQNQVLRKLEKQREQARLHG